MKAIVKNVKRLLTETDFFCNFASFFNNYIKLSEIMKTNDERYKERYKELMDWMSSYQSAKSDDNDNHVVKIKAYLGSVVKF